MDFLKDHFQEFAARAQGDGVELEMLARGGDSEGISFARGKMEEFEASQSQAIGFRVIDGEAQGTSSTERLDREGLERAYRAALESARLLKSSPEKTGEALPAPQTIPDAMEDLYVRQEIPSARKAEWARQMEALALAADPRVEGVRHSRVSSGWTWTRVMNSRGVDLTERQSYFSGGVAVVARQDSSIKSGGNIFYFRSFEDLDLSAFARTGVERATERLGAQPLQTGTFTVLWDRRAARTVLQMLAHCLSGKNWMENRTFLKGRLRDRIASPEFSLKDDPFDRRGLGARPFDSEGCPSKTTSLVEKGILTSVLTNLEAARKLGLPHTASASRSPTSAMDVQASNLVVERGTSTREEMLRSDSRVLLVTDITAGLHAGYRETSGDFSLPAEGFLYENGERVSAVDQFVLSGNVIDLLRNVIAVGSEYSGDPSSLLVPDLLIREMSVAGKA